MRLLQRTDAPSGRNRVRHMHERQTCIEIVAVETGEKRASSFSLIIFASAEPKVLNSWHGPIQRSHGNLIRPFCHIASCDVPDDRVLRWKGTITPYNIVEDGRATRPKQSKSQYTVYE